MKLVRSWFAAVLLTLLALGACAPSVTVVHTIPPDYNLAPARAVAVFDTMSNSAEEDEFVNLFLAHLRRRAFFAVIDARPLEPRYPGSDSIAAWRDQDPASWEAFRRASPAEVIAQVGGPHATAEHACTPEVSADNSHDVTDQNGNTMRFEAITYRVECEVSLELFDAMVGHEIAGFGVVGIGEGPEGDVARSDAIDDAAWQLVYSITPHTVRERLAIDEKAPLAKEGMARIDRGDLPGARSIWVKGMAVSPRSAPLLYNLGTVCEALGDRRAARKYYTEASELMPGEPKYQQALSSLAGRTQDAKVARKGDPVEVAAARAAARATAEAAAQEAENRVDEEKTQAARARSRLIAAHPLSEPRSGVTFMLIPAGSFAMGCTAGDSACSEDEKPVHLVTITRPFYVASTLTSNLEYQRCVGAGACPAKADLAKPKDPVVNVNWQDAQAFCSWIGGRLPTEAEWEHAARGGTEGWRYPWGNEIRCDDANFAPATSRDAKSPRVYCLGYPYHGTSTVGTFAGNGFALYDMAGNVLQWTADWTGSYPAGAVLDPTGPAAGESRVLRGGSWAAPGIALRVSARHHADPASARETIGFRCVRDANPL